MSHRVSVICDHPVSFGFRLAGLRPQPAAGPAEAGRLLAELIEDDRWGVILVQEDLVPDLGSASRRRLRTGLPLIIPFPGPSRDRPPGEAEAYVTELLRRAVGYRVRLR
jgi:vacuolar-type H+-ATPase subunit F/Vma7